MRLPIVPVGCYAALYSLDRSQAGKVAHTVYNGLRSHENHCVKQFKDGPVRKNALCPVRAQRKQFGYSKAHVLYGTPHSGRRQGAAVRADD